MNFAEKFTEYCNQVGCSNKDLSELTGIDPSLLSRLKNGKRTLPANSELLPILSCALKTLDTKKKLNQINIERELKEAITQAYEAKIKDEDAFGKNLNFIMKELNIPNNKLAKALSIDSSLISRLRCGQRRVSEVKEVAKKVAVFLYRNYFSEKEYGFYQSLLNQEEIPTLETEFVERIVERMLTASVEQSDADEASVEQYLQKLDEFNLDEFIEAVHFNDITVPTIPVSLPTTKQYFGIEQMRVASLDFLKSVALSKKNQEVIMYSDINVEKLSADRNFAKKWQMGMAALIKKGCHISEIHCLDRSFNDLMLGLELWIPLYMTGQISPYYFKVKTNSVYCHTSFVAPQTAALSGECIINDEGNGMYTLTKKSNMLEYHKRRSEELLKNAFPLMQIYRSDSETAFFRAAKQEIEISANWRWYLSAPPVFSIPESILRAILMRNGYKEREIKGALQKVQALEETVKRVLEKNRITESFAVLDETQFNARPLRIQLLGLMFEGELTYTWEEYTEHLEYHKQWTSTYHNYVSQIQDKGYYNNLCILIHYKQCVIVSKNCHPMIHFMIRNRKLCEAFEKMEIPLLE